MEDKVERGAFGKHDERMHQNVGEWATEFRVDGQTLKGAAADWVIIKWAK